MSLCVGVSSQIWYIDILFLLLYNGSNIVHDAELRNFVQSDRVASWS